MVDDGSDGETKAHLAQIVETYPLTMLITLPENRGKGGAVLAGIEKAHELGLSHVLQIDADGQHDVERVAFFLEESAACPEAVICGCPEYDDSVPPSRKNGRKIANTWAKIVTLSNVITDVLCGFRVYPVEPVWRISRRGYIDPRMGFDVEILIRLYWKGLPMIFHPVRVIYPEGGISHFHLVRDNIRITWVFIRLFFGMLLRLPLLISRKFRSRGE
jgi:glycosyltransferase involved in cell wall biosynthesis